MRSEYRFACLYSRRKEKIIYNYYKINYNFSIRDIFIETWVINKSLDLDITTC